jgi:type I restriction-modification system DNA methylase subunit
MTKGRADQLALALGPYENRRLFADHFLLDRLPSWPEFQAAPAELLLADLRALWLDERDVLLNANEAQTEERFVRPVLERLGFAFTVQPAIEVGGGRRQPDYALFADDRARAEAAHLRGVGQFRSAVAVCDAKRFDRPLDRRRVDGALSEDPVAQIIQYVAVTRCRWGILTNGRLWRLYAAEGDLVEGACLEFDLIELLEAGEVAPFRWFAALCAVDAFRPGGDGRSLIDRALDGSRAQAVAVGDQLQRQVFAAVPLLAEGLLGDDARTESNLGLAFDNALVLLYRLLFCLNAEDRGLLPLHNEHYAAYSLRRQRNELSASLGQGRVFSGQSDDMFNDLRALFRIVDRGDPALGVNEYDGGLFSADAHPWLRGRSVPDDLTARALDLLYRVDGQQVDYRDLAVRHLGTIFEQLLAFRLEEGANGSLRLVSADGRRQTGAWFTPDYIVNEIVERTLAPLIAERSRWVADAELDGQAALDAMLEMRVLDPAMGSGHFLVAATAYISRQIANDPSYQGELSLTELQGLVAERCIYGVDINPMAVEIARLAMWLSTLREDRPLRFLGNLRCGNSLVGVDVAELVASEERLVADELATRAQGMLDEVARIASIDARSGQEAHAKERLADHLAAARAPLLEACDRAVAPPVSGEAGRPFHWEVEFPEVFFTPSGSPRPIRGFDAIVGNPPYVRIQALGRDLAHYCRQNYATAFGAFDAYVPFLERGIALLKPHGRLGFIVPNKFLKLDYGKRLRGRLAQDRAVEAIVDFGHAQVFEGATNYTCIVILAPGAQGELAYASVAGSSEEVRRAVVLGKLPRPELYKVADLGEDPWVLLSKDERAVIDAMRRAGPQLSDVTHNIFQGLITSADPVYILEDRGETAGKRRVVSRDGHEFALEANLLHPLASGADVDRYALHALRAVLLFPYARVDGQMKLLSEDQLRSLPETWNYLAANEATLRRRERGKMDRDGWWGYVYPKNLGLHDQPKLCVPRLCTRLRASADPVGEVYLDNVDVNGIVPADQDQLFGLLALLNSRAWDWAFRRGSVPFQNDFYSANKQFVAWLPVPQLALPELATLGRALHKLAAEVEVERAAFLEWVASVTGAELRSLKGWRKLRVFPEIPAAAMLEVLDANASALAIDPRARVHRRRITAEIETSTSRIVDRQVQMGPLERTVDSVLAEAYRFDARQSELIDSEFDDPRRAARASTPSRTHVATDHAAT